MKIFEVGGCVRDSFLGVHSKDIDFSVEAPSFKAMREHFQNEGFRIFVENEEFLTIRARFPETSDTPNLCADFVMCRKDGYYSDGRRPDEVIPGTLFDDLSRRDFTINAIAKDVETGQIIDPFNGIQDIQKKIIRCVGNPIDRFHEDSLRVLRALRFSITKGFEIHESIFETFEMTTLHSKLKNVSCERKREELTKMFAKDTLASMELIVSLPKGLKESIFDKNDRLWMKATLESI